MKKMKKKIIEKEKIKEIVIKHQMNKLNNKMK